VLTCYATRSETSAEQTAPTASAGIGTLSPPGMIMPSGMFGAHCSCSRNCLGAPLSYGHSVYASMSRLSGVGTTCLAAFLADSQARGLRRLRGLVYTSREQRMSRIGARAARIRCVLFVIMSDVLNFHRTLVRCSSDLRHQPRKGNTPTAATFRDAGKPVTQSTACERLRVATTARTSRTGGVIDVQHYMHQLSPPAGPAF
jgi:hypothetical protein